MMEKVSTVLDGPVVTDSMRTTPHLVEHASAAQIGPGIRMMGTQSE